MTANNRKCVNMIWANEAGVSVYIYEAEHERRRIEIHGVVNDYQQVLASATVEKHNRNRFAESLSLLDSDSQAAGDVTKERDEWKEFAEECKEGIRASHRVLDELGTPRKDAWLQETDGKNYGIEEVVEYPVHERIKMLPPFIATAMRDKCVEKVKAKYNAIVACRPGSRLGNLMAELIHEIRSLTLESETGETRTK